MNKKKLFGVLTAASMLMNSGVAVFAEEMVEASGVVGAVTNPDGSIAINAQNFPDENLLGAVKIAANGGTDATKITTLSVPSNVENLAGLQYLTGLTSLTVANNNNLSSLDLSTNTALTTLTVDGNKGLVSITLPTTEELGTITITNNNSLTELDLSPASLVTNANLSNNALAKLNVSNNLHLLTLDVHGNVLYALDTTNCRHLTNINAAGNRIYEIDITSRAVINLNLAGNKLTTLDVSEMVNLQKLNVADNMLESIVWPEEETLTYFNCDQNHLASLDLSGVIQGSTPETSGANGVTVITGTQSLFAGTEDKAIDLKAYDANFDPNNTAILDKDGNPTKDKIAKNGIADLAATEVIMPDENPGQNPGTNPGGPTVTPSESVTLTDKNTTIELVESEGSNATTTVPSALTPQKVQPSNLQIVWNPNATPPAPYAIGIQVLDSTLQPTGEWKYAQWDATNFTATYNDEANPTATTQLNIKGPGMDALYTALGLTASASSGYSNVLASSSPAAEFTAVNVIQPTILTKDNARVLGDFSATPPTMLSLEVKNKDNNWVVLQPKATFTSASAVTVANDVVDGDPDSYIVKNLQIAVADLFKIAPYILVNSTSVNLPVVDATKENTLLTTANTRVIYDADTPTAITVQFKDGNNWTTVGDITVFAYDPTTRALTFQTSKYSDLLAQGYRVEDDSVGINISVANSIKQATLDATHARILYVLGDDGKPVVQKVQYNAATSPDLTSDKGWVDVASTTEEAYSMFKFGTFVAPNSLGTGGTLVITETLSSLPIEYAPIASGTTAFPAYPLKATATTTYKLTKVTINNNGTPIEITDEKDLANFTVSDVKPATEEGASADAATATLAYADTADADFQKQYPIDGASITVEATITTGTNTDSGADTKTEEMIEVMTEAQATASTTSVLKPAPVALAYAYDTEAEASGDQMTVKVYKENLMNRLYNPNSGEHFYTKDNHEKDVLVGLGWQYEGIGWVAPNGAPAVAPVYRLYNPNAGDHHYPEDANEKDTLVRVGWYSAADPVHYSVTGEPSAMTGDNGNRTIDVFREYNPNAKAAGAHNYTISENENAVLVSLGWIDEGIAWNALK